MSFFPTSKHSMSKDISNIVVTILGFPGSGKTWLASQAPDVLILATERGYDYLDDVYVMPVGVWEGEPGCGYERNESFLEIASTLRKADHPYKWICVDSIDALWRLCAEHCGKDGNFDHPVQGINRCELNGKSDYKKAYNLVNHEFSKGIDALRMIPDVGFILIGHTKNASFGTEPVITPRISEGAFYGISACQTISLFTYCVEEGGETIYRARTKSNLNNTCAKDRTGVLPPSIQFPKYGGWTHFIDLIKKGMKEND